MEQEKNNSVWDVDLSALLYHFWKAVKSRWWVLIIFCALFSMLLAVFSLTRKPQYLASCTMTVKVVNNSVTAELDSQYSIYYDKDLAEQLEKTFTYILTSDHLTERVAQTLGKEPQTGRMKAQCIKGSNIFEVSATGNTPEQAFSMLTAVMDVFPDAARYVVGDLTMDMVEIPQVKLDLSNVMSWEQILAAGIILGLLTGSAVLVLSVLTRRTVRKPEELEELMNMSCLGVIPRSEVWRSDFRESIRGVARKVEQAMEGEDARVLLVTGTLPGEGQSTTAQLLAETLAEWGKRVCLIDCDLRKPSVHAQYSQKSKVLPLAEYLQGKIDESSMRYKVGADNLLLVGSSLPVEHPTELLVSPNMKALISQMSQKADIVIMDAPPCDTLSDVEVLQQYADRILYVVRQDFAPVSRIQDAVEELCEQDEKLVGYVLTFAAETATGYGKYGYGTYSYGKYGNGYYGKYGYHKKYGRYSGEYYYTEQSEGPSEK